MRNICATIILCLCVSAHAELSGQHNEARDGGKADGVEVDAGAVQSSVTGNFSTSPGTIENTIESGAITTNFQQPLMTMPVKVEAPMIVKEGAFRFELCPRAFSVNVDEGACQLIVQPGAFVATINAKVECPPELTKAVQSASSTAKDVEIAWKYKDWLFGALAALGVLVAWLHGKSQGVKRA